MSTDPLVESTSFLIAQVGMRHRNLALRLLAEVGVHPGQEFLLNLLWHHDGRTQVELATQAGVEPPTISRTVHRLDRAGLVERRADREDGRVQRIWLTARGRALRPTVLRAWGQLEEATLEGLDAQDRHVLRRLLARVLTNLGDPEGRGRRSGGSTGYG